MRRRVIITFVTLCASVIFLFCNSAIRGFCSEMTYPFQRMLSKASFQIRSRFVAAWRGLCDGPTRDNYAIEVERLRVMLQDSDLIAQENRVLRQTLAWQERIPYKVVAAPIFSYGGGLGVWPRLQLAAGSANGIAPGNIVLVPDGLVGRIADSVTLHTSEVILLSDPASRVAAEVPGGVKGIVQGAQGIDYAEHEKESLLYVSHPLVMRFVAKNAALSPGQELYTEGSGGLFIRGIKIGTIIERKNNTADLLSEILVEPTVDPTLLNTVFILTIQAPNQAPDKERITNAR